MPPRMTHRLRISTPGTPAVNPATGLEVTPPPAVADVAGRISQQPVANVGAQVELLADQDTTISFWTVLVPPSTAITSRSTVTDLDNGRSFAIVGEPAKRPDHRPTYIAAAARLISDMQQ